MSVQEGTKAKDLATHRTAQDLNAIFEPGQVSRFDATFDLKDDDLGDTESKPGAAKITKSGCVKTQSATVIVPNLTTIVSCRKFL